MSVIAEKLDEVNELQKAGQEVTPRTTTVFDKIRLKRAMYEGLLRNVDPARFVRVASAAARHVTKCTDDSILGCIMLSAQLDLEPGTPLGHAHLVPFGNECTFIVGYQGYIELARRAGYSVRADAVFEGDEFDWQLGLNPKLDHKPVALERTDYSRLTHVYAISQSRAHPEEPQTFVVMTKDQVEAIRKRARSQSGPWKTDTVQMAIKTPVRRLSKWMPMSIEMAAAAAADESTPREVTNLDDMVDDDQDVIDVGEAPPAAIEAKVGQAVTDVARHVEELERDLDQQAAVDRSAGSETAGWSAAAEAVNTEPAADPIAQTHIDAMASVVESENEFEVGDAEQPIDEDVPLSTIAARAIATIPDERYSAWAAYMRRTGISSSSARWTDDQARGVIEFVNGEASDAD